MQIDHDVKLDFSDVLLKPKRSTLTGRHDVQLEREYKFLHSPHKYTGVPIMASNMDGVGTFSMAHTLAQHKMFTVIRKHYTFEEWRVAFAKHNLNPDYLAISTGTNAIWNKDAEDYALVRRIMNHFPIPFICVDVANSYQQNFIDFIKRVRDDYPDKVIIAGNVITPDAVQELLFSGADIVKCGIGPGCFTGETLVHTHTGVKQIKDIYVGDLVLTHKNRLQRVKRTYHFINKRKLMRINNTTCTDDHKWYVLHRQHKHTVNDANIHQYAEWKEAREITKDYLLLRPILPNT